MFQCELHKTDVTLWNYRKQVFYFKTLLNGHRQFPMTRATVAKAGGFLQCAIATCSDVASFCNKLDQRCILQVVKFWWMIWVRRSVWYHLYKHRSEAHLDWLETSAVLELVLQLVLCYTSSVLGLVLCYTISVLGLVLCYTSSLLGLVLCYTSSVLGLVLCYTSSVLGLVLYYTSTVLD